MDGFSIDIEEITNQVRESLQGLQIDPCFTGKTRKGIRFMDRSTHGVHEKSFEVAPGARLFVHGHGGHIMVRAGDQPVIRIHATGIDEDAHGFEDPFHCTLEENKVTLRADAGPAVLDADFSIEVPHGCAVWVHTVDGDISIIDTHGEVDAGTVSGGISVVNAANTCRVKSVDGDIQIDGAGGSCHLVTVNGDITARRLDGTLRVQTSDGDTRIAESRLTEFNLHSDNGDFSIDTPLVAGGHYSLHTSDGDGTLLVPPGTGATVTLHTVDGDLRIQLPAQNIERGRHHWRGVLGDGSAQVEMHSVNSDLTIRHSPGAPGDILPAEPAHAATRPVPPVPPVPVVPASPPAPPAPPSMTESVARPETHPSHDEDRSERDSTIAVLAELERGNLTVEEALARLDQN
jgi:hypothetical protein